MKRAILVVCVIVALFLSFPAEAQQISGPEVKIVKDDIYVTFSLKLDDERVQEIRNGLDKDFKFYVDLFRVWNVWPDEFVTGKVFTNTMKSDPIKNEYVATTFDGSTLIEKKFRTFQSMLAWTLGFRDIKVANTHDLQPGQYFVRITAESKIRKLPPVIRQFMFFVSENEFKIKKDSRRFAVGGRGK